MRDLSLIVNDQIENRRLENIAIIGVNLEDLSPNLPNVIPVKPFDGLKRDHVFKYL